MVAGLLAAISIGSVTTLGQSVAVQHGAAANREYAGVFAHSDKPCSANYATTPYVQCMSKELAFVEQHFDAFVENLRGVAGSADELAALNKADAAWRAYRESSCTLPLKRFSGGTIKGADISGLPLELGSSLYEAAQ